MLALPGDVRLQLVCPASCRAPTPHENSFRLVLIRVAPLSCSRGTRGPGPKHEHHGQPQPGGPLHNHHGRCTSGGLSSFGGIHPLLHHEPAYWRLRDYGIAGQSEPNPRWTRTSRAWWPCFGRSGARSRPTARSGSTWATAIRVADGPRVRRIGRTGCGAWAIGHPPLRAQAQGLDRRSVAHRIRAPGGRLVPAAGDHLGEAECAAGIGPGSPYAGTRDPVPALKVGALLLRLRSGPGAGNSSG